MPQEYEKNIEKTLHNAFNSFLHNLTINLKSIANTPKGDGVVESLRFLFEQNTEPFMVEKYKCEYSDDKIIALKE